MYHNTWLQWCSDWKAEGTTAPERQGEGAKSTQRKNFKQPSFNINMGWMLGSYLNFGKTVTSNKGHHLFHLA